MLCGFTGTRSWGSFLIATVCQSFWLSPELLVVVGVVAGRSYCAGCWSSCAGCWLLLRGVAVGAGSPVCWPEQLSLSSVAAGWSSCCCCFLAELLLSRSCCLRWFAWLLVGVGWRDWLCCLLLVAVRLELLLVAVRLELLPWSELLVRRGERRQRSRCEERGMREKRSWREKRRRPAAAGLAGGCFTGKMERTKGKEKREEAAGEGERREKKNVRVRGLLG
ncbi:hypothetical protein KY290_015028 [Solanum tuberosum]|uniref:Uncharacterized protein n=1 Tax=Solanum tuberosum TaxID=4113 RepID=A0ABQ7VU04_SOLTU|nr:hypothetical protein KY290_015028 [Solanum tuberosum]